MTTDIILAAVAVIGLFVGTANVLGTFRFSRNTNLITLYRETAEAWEARSKAQDAEISELQTRETTKDAQIAGLNGRVTVLQDMVTGKTMLEEQGRKIDENTAKVLDLLRGVSTEVHAIREAVAANGG